MLNRNASVGLKALRDSGWQQVIEPGDPRLQGRDRLLYTLQTSNLNGLDADYLPTMAEWMQVKNRTPWRLHANGHFLEMSFDRDPNLMDPEKPGAYLLTVNLQTSNEYFRRFVEPKDRLKWRSVLPGVLKEVASQRAEQESLLKAKGTVVLESYVDPKPPLQAVPKPAALESFESNTSPGMYLEGSFTRERTFESDDRVRWKSLLHKVLSGLSDVRVQKERDLKVRAAHLDETYVDPPLPSL